MSGTRSERVRVLIVDDEPGLTEPLSVTVTEAGRRPYPVADGHFALRVAPARARVPHALVFLLGLLLSHPRQVLGKAQTLDHVGSNCFDGGGNLANRPAGDGR